ncbi:MAG: IS1634 family transposase [Chloroflexota bacterium]
MDSSGLHSQRLDHLGIVAGICNQIGLIEQIDQQVGPNKRKVSVGQAVQAMVLNGLGFVSRPLYLSPEFFENKPVELLVGEGITAADLSDDCLGRALDALFESGVTEVFAGVSARALHVFGIKIRYAHLDNTSFGLHGAYAVAEHDPEEIEINEPIPIEITHGYSRDHRPDLKQAVLSMICANSASLPTWIEALSGNTADTRSFPDTIQSYLAQFGESEETPLLVADAALYTEKTLKAMPDRTRWLTRVPGTLKAVKHLYDEVDTADMQIANEDTRYAEVGCYYADVKQRWLLVLHEPSRQRQNTTLQKRIDRERQTAWKALQRLANKDYGCEDAVCKAVDALKKKWHYHDTTLTIRTETRYRQPGRPTEHSPSDTVWCFDAELVEDDARIEAIRRTHGKYVIATNDLDDTHLSAQQMLTTYKSQSSSVERGFRFLKDPLFFAHSLFLKKPSRIMALLMVMGLSLLVYALAEHHIRQQLVERDETLPDQTGKPTQRPTARRVFQMMEGIDVLTIAQGDVQQRLILNLTDLRKQIVRLFGPHVRKLYDLLE